MASASPASPRDTVTTSRQVGKATVKPVVPRQVALDDVEAAVDDYLAPAALGFIDCLEKAYRQLSRHPRP